MSPDAAAELRALLAPFVELARRLGMRDNALTVPDHAPLTVAHWHFVQGAAATAGDLRALAAYLSRPSAGCVVSGGEGI